MYKYLSIVLLLSITLTTNASDIRDSDHAKKSLEIYRTLISIPTVKGRGEVPKLANYDDVMLAIAKAVHPRYPGLTIMAYMESGGTDGMHFRSAGIPTWAMSSIFMNPNEQFAHGLNERLPKKAFYDGLDHWSIILKQLAGKK